MEINTLCQTKLFPRTLYCQLEKQKLNAQVFLFNLFCIQKSKLQLKLFEKFQKLTILYNITSLQATNPVSSLLRSSGDNLDQRGIHGGKLELVRIGENMNIIEI